MRTDRFIIAEKCWNILEESRDPREAARRLVLFLNTRCGIPVTGFRYRDPRTGYGWTEWLDSAPPMRHTGESMAAEIAPPYGEDSGTNERGSWVIDEPVEPEIIVLLDLLIRQWSVFLHTGDRKKTKRTRNRLICGAPRPAGSVPGWIAVSRASKKLSSRLSALANNPASLLILGEPGSGKEYLARLLHDMGPWPDEPFRIGRPEEMESRGTFYLSEPISQDSPGYAALQKAMASMQPPRVVLSGTITEGPPPRWGEEGGLQVRLPSLRERREDIPLLAEHFLEIIVRREGRKIPDLSGTALEALMAYRWPGNITELEAVLKIAVNRCIGERIGAGDFPSAVRGALPKPTASSYPERLTALEYEALREELIRHSGNMTRTAKALGLTPRQISWRVKKYGLDHRDFKTVPAR